MPKTFCTQQQTFHWKVLEKHFLMVLKIIGWIHKFSAQNVPSRQ
jgi:hypothetical protein